MDTILTFDSVSFSYPSENSQLAKVPKVLNNVCLSIKQGELVAIVGHNGSGKSTLAKHTNAILKPDSGSVMVLGMDTRDENRLLDIRQTVGMVFQNPDNQIVATVVEEDIAFALENLGVAPDKIRLRVDEALELVGMLEYKTHAPHRLSGGQKQRVAIGGVLAMRPRCIVFDEPTAMLDPIGRKEVMSVIKQLNKENGTTIIIITHHMDEAAACNRVVVMNNGIIRLDGPPKDVFMRYELLKEVGLSIPQTMELTHRLGLDNAPALTVDECAMSIADWLNVTGR